MTLFALAALLGFSGTTALALWLVSMKGENSDLRDRNNAEHNARIRVERLLAEANQVRQIDAATIVRLKRQLRALSEERTAKYEANAKSGADGGGAAVDAAIRSMYPDADDYGGGSQGG